MERFSTSNVCHRFFWSSPCPTYTSTEPEDRPTNPIEKAASCFAAAMPNQTHSPLAQLCSPLRPPADIHEKSAQEAIFPDPKTKSASVARLLFARFFGSFFAAGLWPEIARSGCVSPSCLPDSPGSSEAKQEGTTAQS